MKPRFRLPMFVVAAALLGLIALLATLQYRWLGRISDAERQRMTSTLGTHSTGFAQEFDREVTRAYATFQLPSAEPGENIAARVSAHYDRWTSTARFPRLIKDIYFASQADGGVPSLQRFSPATKFIEPVEWPESLNVVREQFAKAPAPAAPAAPAGPAGTSFVIRSIPAPVIESVPALVVPAPMLLFNQVTATPGSSQNFHIGHSMSYVVLVLDRDYVTNEMLPALMQQYFRAAGNEADYQVAVVSVGSKDVLYRSGDFAPDPEAKVDASADLLQVRLQEFGALASEVRRFSTMLTTRADPSRGAPSGAPVSIVVQQELNGRLDRQAVERSALAAGIAGAASAATIRTSANTGRWRLMVKHPSGSLEAAVNSARRRNLLVSSSVLALLGVSVGFLVLTTRRAQELARQQMEFVAAVSHELRTPLAVIRSAADNLADGIVHDDPQVRKYGDLVRGESRRLTEMVEQILELAGIHSGQRGFALLPVPVLPLLHDVVRSSSTLIEEAALSVEFDVPDSLPPVVGDEQALRRVFQNLVGNAIKYGASGGWIGVKARTSGREVIVSIADKGIGIPAAEQQKIFEPFYRAPSVIAAQIHGAGLGLSLVQRTVEAHGGRIAVRSAEGSGSEFLVHLPIATEERVPRAASVDTAQTSA